MLLQRGQRARKRPVWLANTVDPHLADPNRLNRPQQHPFSALRYNVRALNCTRLGPSYYWLLIICSFDLFTASVIACSA